MIPALRFLLLLAAVSFISCSNNAGNQTEAPTPSTTSIASPTTEPVQQDQEDVATSPTPLGSTLAAPDREVIRTENSPTIKGGDLTEPEGGKDNAPPPPIAPATAPEPVTSQQQPSPQVVDETRPTTITDAPAVVEEQGVVVVNTPDHKQWDALLGQYVDANGLVNYAALKKNEAKLDAYLATLAENTPMDLWSHNEGLAYWINAYNAFTFKLILKNYPVGSITDLNGGDPWKVKWIELGGKTYSLNNIEHDIIRPRYKDARIHFAVVCAAKSCPPLLNKAFNPEILNLQLDVVTRRFINNSKYNQVNGDVRISKIFEWYQEDFGPIKDNLNRYLGQKIPEGKTIGYMTYDWSLNKQ